MKLGVVLACLLLAGCSGAAPTTHPTNPDDDSGVDPGPSAPPQGGVGGAPATPQTQADPLPPDLPDSPRPPARVVVGFVDHGINPYHADVRRPDLVEHPCTYLPGYPCSIPALNLTLDAPTYDAAVEADLEAWRSVQVGEAYWIPGTAYVAVVCTNPVAGDNTNPGLPSSDPLCILGETSNHGSQVASSILNENPDALLAAAEGGAQFPFEEHGITIDVATRSTYSPVAQPLNYEFPLPPLMLFAAGNDGRSSLVDGRTVNPATISVGGGATLLGSGTPLVVAESGKNVDVLGPYCVMAAKANSLDGEERACGTSFASPSVAGALSLIIQDVRNATGYTGLRLGQVLDPVADLTVADLRAAMNRSAAYTFTALDYLGTPVPPSQPWVLAGWGFFSGAQRDAALQALQGTGPDKPSEAYAYMQAQHAVRQTLYPAARTVCDGPDAIPC